MMDIEDDRPEKDTPEEVPIFSDRDLEDYLKGEEEYSEGVEVPTKEDPSPQILASLKSWRRSKRSLTLLALLCFGLGVLVLAVLFLMKPEVRKPQVVAKRMKRPIPSIERGEEAAIPGAIEKEGREEELPEGGIPEKEEPGVSGTSEPSMVVREGGLDKKVIILGEKELPEEEKEVTLSEGEGIRPEIKGKGEEKPQVAKVEEPKGRAKPGGKLPAGRYTVNVGSFRKRVRAERLRKELEGKGYQAFVAEAAIPQKGTWYRVSVGRFPSRGEAQAFARALKEKDGIHSFVREVRESRERD
jgi:cell division septation protein DedD